MLLLAEVRPLVLVLAYVLVPLQVPVLVQVLQVLVYERQVLSRTVFVLQQELRDVQRLSQRAG